MNLGGEEIRESNFVGEIKKSPITAIILLSAPVVPLLPLLLSPGFVHGADGVANLTPAVHVRSNITALIYTDAWYNGYWPVLHPYSKSFYPFWWPVYVPFLPINLVHRILLYWHIIAAAGISWYYAKDAMSNIPATLIGIQTGLIGSLFFPHHWKWLAFPWLVFLSWQLTPWRVTKWTQRTGLLCGLCIAAMVLTGGGIYYAIYGGFVLLPFLIQYASRDFIIWFTAGGSLSLLKAPAYLTSLDNPRPGVGYGMDGFDLLLSLSGITNRFLDPMFGVSFGPRFDVLVQGLAVVGTPVVGLAAGVFLLRFHSDGPSNAWYTSFFSSCLLMVLFLTGGFQYFFSVDILRTLARASHAVALLVIIGAAVWIFWTVKNRGRVANIAISVLLALSVLQATACFAIVVSDNGATLGSEPEVANTVESMDGNTVWIQDRPHAPSAHSQLQFALAKRGIQVVNPRYPEGLVDFEAFQSGDPTFSILITTSQITEENVELSPLFLSGTGGDLPRDRLSHAYTIGPPGRTWYVYTVE